MSNTRRPYIVAKVVTEFYYLRESKDYLSSGLPNPEHLTFTDSEYRAYHKAVTEFMHWSERIERESGNR